jgi:hypothetical protein
MPAHSQGQKKPRTPEDYRPRTLRELSNLLPDTFAKSDEVKNNDDSLRLIVHGELLPSRVKATYEGITRPLLERRKSLIQQWANQFAGAPEFYTTPYQTEALFSEQGENYWLAVRKESFPPLAEELKKGETAELFLIKMGNFRSTDNKLEPVLLVEKYVKQ